MIKYYKTFGGKGSVVKVTFDTEKMDEIVSAQTYIFKHQDWGDIHPKLIEKFFRDRNLIEISESEVFLEIV